jgi:hypothetical protein
MRPNVEPVRSDGVGVPWSGKQMASFVTNVSSGPKGDCLFLTCNDSGRRYYCQVPARTWTSGRVEPAGVVSRHAGWKRSPLR